MENENTVKALQELRKEEKRKFMQSVDLIVNLQNFDVRKESINTFIQIPLPSQKRICGFLNKHSNLVDTVTPDDFVKYKEAKMIKKFAKKHDFFMANAALMGKIATTFGRVLGPVNKMPSPMAGIIPQENEDAVSKMADKLKKSIRIRTKEKSIKFCIGKEDMSDKELKENVDAAVTALEKALPRNKDNIKNVFIKFTMTKPIKIYG